MINYYSKALSVYKKTGNNKDIADTYNKIGAAYSNWGNYSKALQYLNRSLEIAKKIKNEELLEIIEENKKIVNINISGKQKVATQYDEAKEKEIDDYIGNLKENVVYYKQENVKTLEEIENLSVEMQAKELKILVLQERYEKQVLQNQLKEHKIKNLVASRKIKELELKNERNLRIFLLFTVILIIILAVSNLQRLKKRMNRKTDETSS